MKFNLEITNKNLTIYNLPLIELQEVCHLTQDRAAGSGTLIVDNISGFSIGQYVLLGNFGEPTAEIIRIHTVTAPTGFTITLNSNTLFDHYTDTPVTVLDYNQVEFSRAATLAGVKAVLATSAMSADRINTAYTDLVNTTGFGFARFKNSSTGLFSDYTSGVPYAGNSYLTVEHVLSDACEMAGVQFGEQYATESELISDINEAQDYIGQQTDWSFELIEDTTSITSTENENTYSLSALTYVPKFPKTFQGFLNVRFGQTILKYLSIDQMDAFFQNTAQSTLALNANPADITITLTDSNEFASEGVVFVGENTVTYTANNKTTGVLSGIPITDITALTLTGASVWQGINPDVPQSYSVFNNQLIVNAPVLGTSAGIKFKIRYLKVYDRLLDLSSPLEVPFYNALNNYVAAKIEERKRNFDVSTKYKQDADAVIAKSMERYKVPTLQYTDYYNFATIENVMPDNNQWRGW